MQIQQAKQHKDAVTWTDFCKNFAQMACE